MVFSDTFPYITFAGTIKSAGKYEDLPSRRVTASTRCIPSITGISLCPGSFTTVIASYIKVVKGNKVLYGK
jgi:hypothetical protein